MKQIVVILCMVCAMVSAQESKKSKDDAKAPGPVLLQKEVAKKEVKDGEMKQYFLVLLKRGPIRNQDSTTAAELQKGHLANIERLFNEGKIDIAGPMGNDGDLRGIFVFNCETYDEVMALCSSDPAIKAGRLLTEIYPWWSAKGAKLR
jgi:uncharacterized protein YciI